MTNSCCIHVAANGIILFLSLAKYYAIVYMYHIFMHSFVDGHLGCFCVLVSEQCCYDRCMYLFEL